jgi:hypothetical protein
MLVHVIFRAFMTFVFGKDASTAKRVWAGRSGIFVAGVGMINIALQIANLLGIPFETGPAPYVVGVALYLAAAGFCFLRLLELPTSDRVES